MNSKNPFPRIKSLSRRQRQALKVGDTIKVRTFHYREGVRTVTRKITEVHPEMGIAIKLFGYDKFWLSHSKDKIIEKVKK